MQPTGVAAPLPGAVAAPRRRLKPSHLQQRNLWGLAFALPAMLLFAVFAIWPIAQTFYLSFFHFSVVEPARPAGLENYRQIFSDGQGGQVCQCPDCGPIPLAADDRAAVMLD